MAFEAFNKEPEFLSHNFIDLSNDPLNMRLPSGEKHNEFTALEWPSKLLNKEAEFPIP